VTAETGGPDERLVEGLRSVYTDAVVDHVLNPRNLGEITNADGFASLATDGGDTIRVWLRVKGERITEARFETDSCAATTACTSAVTELVSGGTVAEAQAIGAKDILDSLGGLPEGNLHCADHAAAALKAALADYAVIRREPWKKNYRVR